MKSRFLYNINNIPEENNIFNKNNYIVLYKTIEAGRTFPAHWHDYFEFELILSGQGRHTYNSVTSTLAPGCAYLMSYNDFHSLETLTDLEIVNIRFNESLLDESLVQAIRLGGKFNCKFDESETEKLLGYISSLSEESVSDKPFAKLSRASLLSKIIIEMIRKCGSKETTSKKTPVQKAIYYIYENFREPLSLERVSKELSISQNHLGSLIKKEIGMSFSEYLSSVRLKYACDLLKNTNMSVKEIAFSSGYGSVEYFLYAFKQKLKTTPSKYRSL